MIERRGHDSIYVSQTNNKWSITRPLYEDIGRLPEDYLLVGADGDPDLAQDPLEFCVAYMRTDTGAVDTRVFLTSWPETSTADSIDRYITSHTSLVRPLQQYLECRTDHPLQFHRSNYGRSQDYSGIVAGHFVYPDDTAALFVARNILPETNQEDHSEEPPMDLVDLVAAEDYALQDVGHIAAQALASISRLVKYERLMQLSAYAHREHNGQPHPHTPTRVVNAVALGLEDFRALRF